MCKSRISAEALELKCEKDRVKRQVQFVTEAEKARVEAVAAQTEAAAQATAAYDAATEKWRKPTISLLSRMLSLPKLRES